MLNLLTGSGSSPSASASAKPSGSASASPSAGATVIDGPATQTPLYNSTFTINGTAPASSTVTLHFHKTGTPASDYSLTRTVGSDAKGKWSRTITANQDYRYYATAGSGTSATVLNQPAPTVDGPRARQIAKDSQYSLTGAGLPGGTLYLHFHAAGTPTNDYTLVRSVTADSSGHWVHNYIASQD